jgi:hypothetical protein
MVIVRRKAQSPRLYMRTRISAVSGTDGSTDGWLVVVAAIAGVAAMWFYARSFRRG